MRKEHEQRQCSKRGRRHNGAQTFRRGRALAFYEQLMVKRETLKQQLESPELQSIHPMIAGELKATEGIINEFKAAFELDEFTGDTTEDQI
ncbi:MAG: 2-keto-3-deoxygluconate kinase [Lysinibacillus sp.]